MPAITVTVLSLEEEGKELLKKEVSDETTLRDLASQVLGDAAGKTCSLSLDGVVFPRQSSALSTFSEGASEITLKALIKDA
mmetsp:Transcript_8555/g.23804  ORF Transcript_8555/g.23804 Transcript_8555/m.23804 type:complete len:81 (+) Transcript_8555:79-321(+)|eukprot:CAMPEP_0194478416 /NCGR_PEP_ID=MMETSP0253-20130528/1867_1 /TAXON_ID=2966 /ORGANISM="Noctiluca scintillans" /LENGTH=80 /DNA_ID=CAMNT_0039317499 /DNA_START=84 /DNA_END=326 /DNA_ORIENTATION=-